MAVTSWKAAGTVADDATTGTRIWYADAGLSLIALVGNEGSANDGDYAEVAMTSLGVAHYLKCTNFGFTSSDVPSGATIDGIEWRFSRFRVTNPTVASTNTKLVKAGSIVGSTITAAGDWPLTETSTTMGGATELGGTSWTQSDIVDSGFGVGISLTCNSARVPAGAATHLIEIVEMRVHYTAGSSIKDAQAFAQIKVLNAVTAYSKTTAGRAFGTVAINGVVAATKNTNIYQYYGLGASLNISQMTTDAPLLRDNSVGDNTTYYDGNTSASQSALSAYFDLGSAKQVGRMRMRFAIRDGGEWALDGSNDGTSWTNAFTGFGTFYFGSGCVRTWQTEVNTTQITTTSYRYWRLTVTDTNNLGCPTMQVSLGDYRLYDTSGNEYVPGSPPAPTPVDGSAFAQVQILGLTRATRIKRGSTTALIRIQSVVNAARIRFARGLAQISVSTTTTVSKTKSARAFSAIHILSLTQPTKVTTRASINTVVVAGVVNIARLKPAISYGIIQVVSVDTPSNRIKTGRAIATIHVQANTVITRLVVAQATAVGQITAILVPVRIKVALSLATLQIGATVVGGQATAYVDGSVFGVIRITVKVTGRRQGRMQIFYVT